MKTIEEAAIEHAKNLFFESSSTQYLCKGDFTISFIEGVEFAQRWIPVEEELPKIGEKVITKMTKDKRASYGIATRIREEWEINAHWIDHTFSNMTITHWRPIEYK